MNKDNALSILECLKIQAEIDKILQVGSEESKLKRVRRLNWLEKDALLSKNLKICYFIVYNMQEISYKGS